MTTFARVSRIAGALMLAGAIQTGVAAVAQAADDSPIVQRVESALDSNPAVTGSDFKVTAQGSRVELSGVASNEFEEQQALATAKRVPGVSAVINHTEVDSHDQLFDK